MVVTMMMVVVVVLVVVMIIECLSKHVLSEARQPEV